MIERGRLPIRCGQWIDTYNQVTDEECAGTIIAGINAKNHYYVMEELPLNTEPDGTCRTIKAQYQQSSRANFVRGDSLGATGVVSIQQKGRGFNKGREHDVCTTITKNSWECNNHLKADYRIRKLTPRECFRLMGVCEPDIDTLLSAGISNSQLYKLAGNSIVVNCLAGIFRQLFIGNLNDAQQLEIF